MASLYSSLDAARREIRVLTIQSDVLEDSVVSCNLRVVSLDERPKFTALSYCWGASDPPGDLRVNGIWGKVTPNLAAALRHLRRTKDAERTPIWIDALCIHQSNLEERSAQVAMMMSIYDQAQCVHVWLGDEIGPSRDAMETLKEIDLGPSEAVAESWYQQSVEHVAQKLGHLVEIGLNPYWRRMWILQEVSFADHVVMHARDMRVDMKTEGGKSMMELDIAFKQISRFITTKFASHAHPNAGIEPSRAIIELAVSVGHILDVIQRVNWSRTIELINETNRLEGDIGAGAFDHSQTNLFIVYRGMLSSDPKDKIFGLLGFVADFHGMQPDYTKSVRDIYCAATLQLMRRAKDLSYLNQACCNELGLPSWVPNYSKPCLWPSLAVADRNAWAASNADASFDTDKDGILLVRGLVFDSVASVRRSTYQDYSNKVTLQREWTNWLSFHPALLRKAASNYGEWSTRFADLYTYVETGTNMDDITRYRQWWGSLSPTSQEIPPDLTPKIARLLTDYELFSTQKGYFGIAPRGMISSGHRIAIIAGARLPFCVTMQPHREGQMTVRLESPIALDGDVDGHGAQDLGDWHAEWLDKPHSPNTALAKHQAWINADTAGLRRYPGDGSSIMQGAIVIAEAWRRFNDPSRIDDVFEDMAII